MKSRHTSCYPTMEGPVTLSTWPVQTLW